MSSGPQPTELHIITQRLAQEKKQKLHEAPTASLPAVSPEKNYTPQYMETQVRKVAPKVEKMEFKATPEAADSANKITATQRLYLGAVVSPSQRRIAMREAEDLLVSGKAAIDNLKNWEDYEAKKAWFQEAFAKLCAIEWGKAREEVAEILYKWGRFLLDNNHPKEGLERFWEIYEKFKETRWHSQVFEELVALSQSEDMVFIPGGNFVLADTGKEYHLDPYFIDIYPITNVQYAEFIKDTGYSAPSHWTKDLYPIGKANHPVAWVSYEDALAYACWKNKRLPLEMEWENAARGPENLLWPWSKQYESKRCNCRESRIGDTTPVGLYRSGKSFYQCYDLAGNVWEWTESFYEEEHLYRVLRGGSWFTFEEFTSTNYRYFDFPDSHKGTYGFRCAKSFLRPKK